MKWITFQHIYIACKPCLLAVMLNTDLHCNFHCPNNHQCVLPFVALKFLHSFINKIDICLLIPDKPCIWSPDSVTASYRASAIYRRRPLLGGRFHPCSTPDGQISTRVSMGKHTCWALVQMYTYICMYLIVISPSVGWWNSCSLSITYVSLTRMPVS